MKLNYMMRSLNDLPEDCLSTILSFSSPRDVCRVAAACEALRLSAGSDSVWESFLPLDYDDILSRAADPLMAKFRSKKELFFLLCNSILIDDARKIFVLHRNSGLRSYILSARELSIAWANDPLYWSWKKVSESRFNESAELRTISWLEIRGNINTKMLSSNTTYAAYLIFNISKRAYGLETMHMETSIQVGKDLVSNKNVSLLKDYAKNQHMPWILYYDRKDSITTGSRVNNGLEGLTPVMPGSRGVGWMEIEIGQFFTGSHDYKEVKMSVMETKGYHLKGGLVVEGIEIRPLLLV